MTYKQERKIISVVMAILMAVTLLSLALMIAAVQEASRLQYDLIDAKAGEAEITDAYNNLVNAIQEENGLASDDGGAE